MATQLSWMRAHKLGKERGGSLTSDPWNIDPEIDLNIDPEIDLNIAEDRLKDQQVDQKHEE